MTDTKHRFRNRKIVTLALKLLAMGLTAYAISIYLNIFVSNHLTSELYGDFTVTLRSLNLISTVLLLGSNFVSVKYLSKYISNKKSEHITCFIDWNFKLIFKTSTLCIILSLVLFLTIYILHVLNIKDLYSYHYVTYTLWLAPFSGLVLLLSSYILSTKKGKLFFAMSQIAQNLFLLVIFCVAIFFFDMNLKYSSILITIFIVLLLIITIESISLSDIFTSYVKIRKTVTLKAQPNWMQDSLKFIFANILYTTMCATDLYIIEIFHTNEASVGHYSAILVIGSLLIVTIPKATCTILKPKITTMISNNRHKELNELTLFVVFINFLSLTPILLGIIFFSKTILSLFGTGYSSAHLPLIITSISYYMSGMLQPYSILLFYTNATKGIKIDILQLLITICLGIPFTYLWGLLGISISVAIALSVSILYKYITAKKEMERQQQNYNSTYALCSKSSC
jgi:O-antigen/teichoic acid export membrane protein